MTALTLPPRAARRSPLARVRARRDRGGVALLLVIAAIMILTTLVTDLSFGANIRIMTAAHERDEIQARYLARSGVSMYRLILTANKQIAKNPSYKTMMEAMGVPPGDGLWKMIPFINTGLLRMLLVSDGNIDEEDAQAYSQSGQVSEEIAAESREEGGGRFSGRNFLDFEGDFTTTVRGEDCRVNVNMLASVPTGTAVQDSAIGQMLAGMMSGEESEQWLRDRNLDKWDLINNLRDWVDADNVVASGKGGYEDDFYNRLASPYLSKNARFDTPTEIRLVEGWQEEVYERFSPQLTIYGSGKVNINCAEDDVIKGLIRDIVDPDPTESDLERILEELRNYTSMASFKDGKDFISWLTNQGYNANAQKASNISASTNYFTLTSEGQVAGATAKITAVFDFSSTDEGKVLYWRED